MTEEPKVEEPEVSWSPAEDKEPGRDFEGVVIEAVYPYQDPSAKFEGVQLRILIRSNQYEKDQPIWIPPSTGKGTKWVLFRDALATLGVMKTINVRVSGTNTEKLQDLCKGLLGMKFRWQDQWVQRPNNPKEKMRVTMPVKFIGKEDISAMKAAITTEKVDLG